MRKIYKATRPDPNDGYGPSSLVGYFENKKDAVKAVSGLGVMGNGDGYVDAIPIYKSFDQYRRAKEKADNEGQFR